MKTSRREDPPPCIIPTETVKLLIYPNPARKRVFVESDTQITRTRIFDALGQLVYDAAVGNNSFMLNVSHYNPGIYIIHFLTPKGPVIERLQVIPH